MKTLEELIKKLKASYDAGKSLTIKADIDSMLLLEDLKRVKMMSDELIKLDEKDALEYEKKFKGKFNDE